MQTDKIVKIVNITGTTLSVVATILSSWAGTQTMKSQIAKEVAKQVKE